jgi:hypothetical protein
MPEIDTAEGKGHEGRQRGGAVEVRGGGNGAWKKWRDEHPPATLGWRSNCDPGCVNGDKFQTQNPCVVLDPFMGSGTTALVARKHGRRSIGIELNPEYADLAARRLQQLSLLA